MTKTQHNFKDMVALYAATPLTLAMGENSSQNFWKIFCKVKYQTLDCLVYFVCRYSWRTPTILTW